ncbi:MAG: DUF4232 domain-containing protein [Jatrophihabitantaceae bacterium]
MTALRTRLAALAAAASLVTSAVLATGGPAEAAAVPACGNSALSVTHTPSQGATGHGSFVLLFRNVSHRSCTIHGYPGLDALNSTGHVLVHAHRTLHGFAGGASSVATVTVNAGRFASAVVEWMNFNPVTSGDCTFSSSVATTPANTTHTVDLKVSVSVCDLQVHPTVAGTSGNNGFTEAQVAWKVGASASSARQGQYWNDAAIDLRSDGVTWASEIAQLRQLIALPDADQTSAQNATYRHDIAALDAFFGTPGLYT